MCQFTVIIPTYNRSRLVQRAIDSALGQSLPPARIIVIDDGSTDNTAEVCARYGSAIDYVRQKNAGVSAARNSGIRLAKTPWIAFLDSDDYWTPVHLEKIAAAIKSTAGQARFYFTDMALPGPGDWTIWKKFGFQFTGAHRLTPDGSDWVLAEREPSCIQCCVFSTELLRLCGGFDPRFRVTEDRELFCRLGIGHPVCAVNAVGCVQTADDVASNRLGGIVRTNTEDYWDHEALLWTSVLARFPKLPEPYRRALCYNLASTYWRLARLQWRRGKPAQTIRSVIKAAQAQPAFLVWLITRRRSDGWETEILPRLQPAK
jgi:glycosyltransferase involved in cell wall biosynthesis